MEKCPPSYAKNLYLLYAKMEEEHGLARHAMQVYSRATKAVPPEEKLAIYNIYLQHAQQIYGITKTREIYQVKEEQRMAVGGVSIVFLIFFISVVMFVY